jgi:hypothetical protein
VEGTSQVFLRKYIVFVKIGQIMSIFYLGDLTHFLADLTNKHIIDYEKKLAYASEKLGLEMGSPFDYTDTIIELNYMAHILKSSTEKKKGANLFKSST